MDTDLVYRDDAPSILLPRGSRILKVALWDEDVLRLRELIIIEASNEKELFEPKNWVNVTVALISRPDNSYNSEAISVSQPSTFGGDFRDRHLGYVHDADHESVGGKFIREMARTATDLEVRCEARVRMSRKGELQLLLPSRKEVHSVLSQGVNDISRHQRPYAPGPRPATLRLIPPSRIRQAAFLASRAQENLSSRSSWTDARANFSEVRIKIRSVFGKTSIKVTNPAGGILGQVKNEVLFLGDEKYRAAAMEALAQASIQLDGTSILTDEYPNAFVVNDPNRWTLMLRGDVLPMGWYEPLSGILFLHAMEYRQAACALLARLGASPIDIAWQAPEAEFLLKLLDTPRIDPNESERRDYVRSQFWRMPVTMRQHLPDELADLSPLVWTNDAASPDPLTEDIESLISDSYYLSNLESLFGSHVKASLTRRSNVVKCRLCGNPALLFPVASEAESEMVSYCRFCTSKAVRGLFVDSGSTSTWEPLAIWAMQDLCRELGSLPSEIQIPRLVDISDPVTIDHGLLVRMHVPRTPRKGVSEQDDNDQERAPFSWYGWLNRSGLLIEGKQTARGIINVARDGHLCRSLLERHIDDFFTANNIPHEVEPNWPYDQELNTTGMRADWLLPGGTFVEAWGMPENESYAAKMVLKRDLADRYQIRLIELTSKELAQLPEIFGEWIASRPKHSE